MSIQPIVPNLIPATTSFTNKYGQQGDYAGTNAQQIIQSLSSLPSARVPTAQSTILPLALYDAARANRGLSPLGPKQSALALRTLTTQEPATPPRRQGFFKSALSDLRSLVTTIPKLPLAAINEAKQLSSLPEAIPQAISEGSNPVEQLGNLANLPGLRLIPGSFVAGQFGDEGQGAAGLMAHPLYTFLDLLPAASGVARGTKVAKAATLETAATNEARALQAAELTGAAGNARLLPTPRPLQTALTRTLDESGKVVPNALGRGLQGATDAFYSTPAGRGFQATFKERDLPRLESRHTALQRQFADLEIPRSALPSTINNQDITPLLDLRDRTVEIVGDIERAKITPERQRELFSLAENPRLPDGTPTTPERIPGLSDVEQGILAKTRDFYAEKARLTEGDLTKTLNIDGTPEVFDLPTAQKLSAAQSTAARAREMRDARAMVTDPTTVTPERVNTLLDDVESRRSSGAISNAVADDLVRTYRAALDEAGYEWHSADGRRLYGDEAGGAWDNAVLRKVVRPSDTDLLAAMRPLSNRYATLKRTIDYLQTGQWAKARADLDAFASTRAGGAMIDALPFDIDGLKAELSRRIARDRTLARTSKYTDKRVETAERVAARVESRAVPARFVPAVQQAADEAIIGKVKERYATDPDLNTYIDMASNRVYDTLSELPTNEIRTIQRESRESWKAMRDAGLDPIFFSRVTPAQRSRLPFIRVSDTPVTPAAAKARMWDAAPYEKDIGVALTKDAMDLLQRRGTEAFLDEFSGTYGRTRKDLVAELYPRAQARAENTPNISVQTHLDNLLNERWAPWDRSKYSGKKSIAAFSPSSSEQIMVPRVMSENMERLYSPPLPKLTAAFDPIMKVFRTSVLPLAPRWHIYNTIGGAMMTAVSDPRAFRYLPETIKEMWGSRKSAGGLGARAPHIEGAPPTGFGTIPPDVRAWDAEVKATSPYKDRLAATHNYAAGKTLNRWFNEARDGRLGKITNGAKRALEKSYTANQMVDDMYRSAIGVSARKRALKAGATAELADAAAVTAIRRVFQSWDEMTPMERSIMRSVVPFYGWTAHILKFAMKYPFDHPLRVAVLGSFARAELTDAATGLPEYIRDMILMGDTRANGIVKGINVGPFNPFRDVPSNFTVAGFLGNLNPVITGALESVGVNTQQGGPSLYPELRYDPETGRLVADPSGNLFSNIAGNVLPQINLFTAVIGKNESFNSLLARDPEAAGRQLMSNLGIPVFYRSVNMGEQLIRSEMARYEDQQLARKEALSTGDLSLLDDFPGLKAYGEQVRALEQAGQLEQLRPVEGEEGAPSGAGLAYALQTAALG